MKLKNKRSHFTKRTMNMALASLLVAGNIAIPHNVLANNSYSGTTIQAVALSEASPIEKEDASTQTDFDNAKDTSLEELEKATPVKENNESNAREIDKAIRGLNYDKNEILSSNGESVESFVPREGVHNNGSFIVVERNKKSIFNSPVDISVINSIVDRTYPGSLQLANRSLIENKPTAFTLPRKPINISIDLPGLGSDNTILVEKPTYGNVSAAIDTLINRWSERHGKTHTLPAQTQYSETMVYSKAQLEAALNVNADLLEKSLGINFKAISSGEKNVMVVAYKQIFYTVSAETPSRPSDLFDDSVTADELFEAGMNNSNPPLMVSNVAYGRTIYVKLETSSKSKDVEAAFKALIKKVNIEGNTKYQDILKNSSFTAVVLGGDAKKHSELVTKDFDQIRQVIKDNSEFSITNPGYPISYTGSFLKDNSIAVVNKLTEYIETTSTEFTGAKINLDHKGAYVAQFAVTWNEVSYDEKGNEVLTPKEWEGNWKDRTAHFNTVIPIPANARNIKVLARECTGLAWEWWRNIVNENNVPLSKDINVSVWGTTLYPRTSVTFNNK